EETASAPAAEPTPDEQAGNGASGAADEVVRRFLYEKEGETPIDGDWQRVETEARAALEREPDNKQLRAQSLLAEGQVAFLRGDHASALVSFNKSVLADPEYVAAHYALGNAYLATNQPAEAFKSYQRAANINKDLVVALRGMGDALTKQGKSREAAQYYSRAKSFGQPLPTNTGLVAARDLKKRKRWAEAVRQFEEVARAEPSSEVFVDIGDCYVGLEQPLSASKAYLKAIELDPKSAVAHHRYAEVMFKLREYASAMESYERALALDTTGATFNRKQARERANEAAKKLGLRKDN
ncbi:MAG TPA: tetratricopeptide repeat protein, partial [Pyrinomonadaceae bacterium]|nr:tetratricopeptide repeat protein [Pyrinomonadaceae bacterium]